MTTKNGKETQSHNYVTANRFYVEMESTITASFSECSGVAVKIKRDTYTEGGVNEQQRIILGQAEFSDVTLKRGITNDLVFWQWVNNILQGKKAQRRNINILLFNQAGETMQCWTLIGAIPVGWKAPALQANATSLAIEELTLSYEGLKINGTKAGGAEELTKGRMPKSGYFASSF
ncbi:MAG: phage tail protein [Scytonematopsis contorta HA4267-MV1]|jgi:phage tail-like protein|nr:phage tail protein [Scytonematopsis contorta HA4267-MV1]